MAQMKMQDIRTASADIFAAFSPCIAHAIPTAISVSLVITPYPLNAGGADGKQQACLAALMTSVTRAATVIVCTDVPTKR